MSRINLDNLKVSDAVRRRNPSIFLPESSWKNPAEPAREEKQAAGKRRSVLDSQRPRKERLNKTETRFLHWLDLHVKQRNNIIIVQPPRLLELEGGGTYTPDFIVVQPWGMDLYEVKGGYEGPGWEQGIERYKRAAAQYASATMRFTLAEWDTKENTWEIRQWKTKNS